MKITLTKRCKMSKDVNKHQSYELAEDALQHAAAAGCAASAVSNDRCAMHCHL